MPTRRESPAHTSTDESAASIPGTRIVTIASSKGGVGKTTLANNLAIYARTVDPSLPVLVIGLDASSGPDDMFAPDEGSSLATAYTALRRGCFESAIRRGRYGIYYVPSSPRIAEPMNHVVDPYMLKRALRKTAFPGLVILDTKNDLGILTRNAIAASDLSIVPATDLASLFAAQEVFDLLEQLGRPRAHARVVLSMIDLRIKYRMEFCGDVLGLLVATARRLQFPLFQSFIARSPRVQALATNPEGRTCAILNDAGRTSVHQQMGDLAEELLELLEHPALAKADVPHAAASSSPPEEPLVWLRPRTAEAAVAVRKAGHSSFCARHFPFFIGRDDPGVLNDLAIPDLQPWQVSRRHAHLVRREGRIGVMDLGSTQGTWVNGHELGGPSANPGPVFLGAKGGVLTLGKRASRYVFDVAVGTTAEAHPVREDESPPTHKTGLASAIPSLRLSNDFASFTRRTE